MNVSTHICRYISSGKGVNLETVTSLSSRHTGSINEAPFNDLHWGEADDIFLPALLPG